MSKNCGAKQNKQQKNAEAKLAMSIIPHKFITNSFT